MLGWADTTWSHFASVAALEAAAIGVLGVAAWGQTLAHGERAALTSWARAATLLALAAGCWVPAMAASWSGQWVLGNAVMNWQEARRKSPPPASSFNITPAVLTDGRVGLKITQWQPDPNQPNQGQIVKIQFTTLDGQPLRGAQEVELSQDIFPGFQVDAHPQSYRWFSSILWPYYSSAPQPGYYFLHERTLCGVDPATRKISGSLGPSGYRDASQSPEPFPPGTFIGDGMVVTPHAIYAVSPVEKTVSVVFSVTDEHFLGLSFFQILDKSNHDRGTIRIGMTNKHLFIFPPEPSWRPEVTLSLEGLDLNKHVWLQQSLDGKYFVVRQSDPVSPTFLVFDAHGKLQSKATYDVRSTLDIREKLGLPTSVRVNMPELSASAQVIAGAGEAFKSLLWQSYQQYKRDPVERANHMIRLELAGAALVTLLSALAMVVIAWKYRLAGLTIIALVLAALLLGPLTLLVFAGITARRPHEQHPAFSHPNGTEIFA